MCKVCHVTDWNGIQRLSAETVQGLSLPLEGIDNIHGSDSLSAGMLRVSDTITDNILKEDFEDTTGLLIDQTRDTLDTTTTSQTTNGRLGNTLDIVTKHLTMTLWLLTMYIDERLLLVTTYDIKYI